MDLLKDEHIDIRIEAGINFALDDLKKLLKQDGSAICRELMAEAIQARLLNDSEHPIAPALVKRYPGLGIFELYRNFVCAQRGEPGYTFVESIKIGGVVRYILATPNHVVAKGGVYKSRKQQLRDLVPGATDKQISERLEQLGAEIEAKNKARKDALRAANPDKAKAADKIIKDAEQAEKVEG